MTADITRILQRITDGDQAAFDELMSHMYAEMRQIADRHIRKNRVGHTLQTTALVHEAYLKLLGQEAPSWESRVHFLNCASRAMRHVLVDSARKRLSAKRGGDLNRGDANVIDCISAPDGLPPENILSLHEALDRLAEYDERKASIIELRYFGGLSSEEVAEVKDMSKRTVERDVKYSLAWLQQSMAEHGTRT